VEHGTDIDKKDKHGNTPLFVACHIRKIFNGT